MVEYKYFIKPLTGLHQVWQDVTHAVVKGKELKLRKGFSSLSSAVDMGSVSVELHMASLEDAVLLHVGRRQVLITANGSPIFEGVSYDDSNVSLKERSDYVFATLKFKPYSAFFETAIAPADIALVDKKICDPTDKANSLLHILFDLIVENVDPEVQPILEDVFQLETAIVNTKVLRLFLIEEGENLEDYLTEFLYHSGYAYYMDLHTVKVITPYGGYPSTSVSIKDIIASPRISQAPYIDEHKVVVRLGKIITADNEVVYELNPARDEETGEPTETAYLPPASFYPLDIDDEPSILEADYGNEKESDDVELAYAENVSLSYDARQIDPSDPSKTIPASLLVTEETLKPTSAELQFKNVLFVDVSLRNVVVTAGRAYYRDWSEEHEDASSKAREIETIDGLYLPDSFSAKAFIDRYVAEEEAERTKITFKTHLVFEPGAVLEFSDIPYPLLVRYVTQLDETYFEYECVAHLIPSSTIKTRVRVAPKRIPRDGVIGPEGRGVVSVVTEYTLGDSSTELEEVELSPDLVAYLPFNGTAKDYVSGQIASATDVSVVNGPGVKKAYLFNGSTSRITVPDIGSSPKGFSVMVYVDAIPTGNEIVLVHGTSKIGLGFYSNGSLITGACGGTNPKVAIISNFNTGEWNNIVVNYISGGAEVFINGVELSYSSATNCWTAGGNDLTIGFRDTSSPGPFKGALADLRVYSRNITPADYDDILEDLQRVTTVWDTTPPDRQAGQFLWTRQVITYTDDTVIITEPTCIAGGRWSEVINFGLCSSLVEIPKTTPWGESLMAGDYFLWGGGTVTTSTLEGEGFTFLDDLKKGEIYEYSSGGWKKSTNGDLVMTLFDSFADLANDVDSAVLGNAVIKNLVSINAFIQNLVAENLQAGAGTGLAGSGFRFRAKSDKYGDGMSNPVFDVMFGDQVLFKVDIDTGKIYFGEHFWYDPNDRSIRSSNDKFVIDSEGNLSVTEGSFSGDINAESGFFRGRFDAGVLRVEEMTVPPSSVSITIPDSGKNQAQNLGTTLRGNQVGYNWYYRVSLSPSSVGFKDRQGSYTVNTSEIKYIKLHYVDGITSGSPYEIRFYKADYTPLFVSGTNRPVAIRYWAISRPYLPAIYESYFTQSVSMTLYKEESDGLYVSSSIASSATGAGLDNYQVYIDNGYLKVKLP